MEVLTVFKRPSNAILRNLQVLLVENLKFCGKFCINKMMLCIHLGNIGLTVSELSGNYEVSPLFPLRH